VPPISSQHLIQQAIAHHRAGRFADAIGTLTVICQSGPPSQVGAMLLIKANCRFTGQISY